MYGEGGTAWGPVQTSRAKKKNMSSSEGSVSKDRVSERKTGSA
jgi:hypothetical protein